MIDLHSHILPGLDDGSRSMEESLAMARMAVDSGVTVMAATPHCGEDRAKEVFESWRLLRQALREARIPLKVYPGMEIFGSVDTLRLLREKKLFTLNGSRYPLVEFSFRSDGEEESRILGELLDAGYCPIVAHPERYACAQQVPQILNRWCRMGCLFQVNRGSLLGRFGRQAQRTAAELLERGFVTVVASDAHSAQVRTPWMRDIRKLLTEEFSPGYAQLLLVDNPEKILQDESISAVAPEWF